MPENNKTLREFLRGHLPPELAREARDLLEPFQERAEEGAYQLARGEDVDSDAITAALDLATQTTVSKTVLVSVSDPFPRGSWVRPVDHRANFRESLRKGVRSTGAYKSIYPQQWRWVAQDHYDVGGEDLEFLRQTLLVPLRKSFKRSVGSYLHFHQGENAWWCIERVIRFYLGNRFAEVGDRDRALKQLTPILRILPYAVPVGEMKEVDGAWLVLVA